MWIAGFKFEVWQSYQNTDDGSEMWRLNQSDKGWWWWWWSKFELRRFYQSDDDLWWSGFELWRYKQHGYVGE